MSRAADRLTHLGRAMQQQGRGVHPDSGEKQMTNADMPAIPVTEERIGLTGDRIITTRGGFTKREELAARNMAAILCSNPPHDVEHEHIFEYMTTAAGYAVMSADALLSVLGKEET